MQTVILPLSRYVSSGGHQGAFDAQDFKLFPSAFYLEEGQHIDVQVDFCSHEVCWLLST